jgi:hypothetical protein
MDYTLTVPFRHYYACHTMLPGNWCNNNVASSTIQWDALWPEKFGVQIWGGKKSLPYPSRPALGPTQPPVRWVLWLLPLGQSSWGGGNDYPHSSSTEVKMSRALPLLPSVPAWHVICRPLLFQSLQFRK